MEEINIDFSKYTVEQLNNLRGRIGYYIHNLDDGFLYICQIRSFGSNWTQELTNLYSVKELCEEYNGDNGIIDIYTSNPNIQKDTDFYNYGETFFIRSKYDYDEFIKFTSDKNCINDAEEDLDKWEQREKLPFRDRPTFEPIYNREELDEIKKEFENTHWDFITPKSIYEQ